jgi:transcriptional regulator with XRE-family HTH domain
MLLQRIEQKGKTQRELASELGIAQPHLSDLIKGRRQFSPRILRKLGYDPTPHYRKAKEGTT